LTAQLLKLYEAEIDTLTLIPSTGGRFEVTVDTQLVFSKIRSERKPYPDEVEGLVGAIVKGGN
jgi:selenoprotein W-related protein